MTIKLKTTLIAAAVLLSIGFAYSQDIKIPKPEISDDINRSIMLFWDNIPSSVLTNYGINNKCKINSATLGKPVAVYTIEADSLKFTNTWRIPLIIYNEHKALFTLFKNSNDEYKIVDFGAVSLAKELFNFGKENDFSAILRVYQLRKDFLMFTNSKGELKFQPIPIIEKKEFSLKEIIALIK